MPKGKMKQSSSSLSEDDIPLQQRLSSKVQAKKKQTKPTKLTEKRGKIAKSSQAKKFVIPRKKKTRELFEKQSPDARDAKDLLRIINQSFYQSNLPSAYNYEKVMFIHNSRFDEEFSAKKQAMRQSGRTQKDLEDSYAYLFLDRWDKVKKMSKEGLRTGSSSFTTLGDPQMGVYLSRYPDLVSSHPLVSPSGYLMVFKVAKGKLKAVGERGSGGCALEPTPNFDGHMSKSFPPGNNVALVQAFISSQYYFYEFMEDGDDIHAQRPRQCCPYAVVPFSVLSNHALFKDLPVRNISNNNDLVPLMDVSPTADGRMYRDFAKYGRTLWSGVVKNKNNILSTAHLICHSDDELLFQIGEYIDIKAKVTYEKLQPLLPSPIFTQLPVISGKAKVFDRRTIYLHCEIKPQEVNNAKLVKLISLFRDERLAGVAEFPESGAHIYVTPTSDFTHQLGLTDKYYPDILHALLIKKLPKEDSLSCSEKMNKMNKDPVAEAAVIRDIRKELQLIQLERIKKLSSAITDSKTSPTNGVESSSYDKKNSRGALGSRLGFGSDQEIFKSPPHVQTHPAVLDPQLVSSLTSGTRDSLVTRYFHDPRLVSRQTSGNLYDPTELERVLSGSDGKTSPSMLVSSAPVARDGTLKESITAKETIAISGVSHSMPKSDCGRHSLTTNAFSPEHSGSGVSRLSSRLTALFAQSNKRTPICTRAGGQNVVSPEGSIVTTTASPTLTVSPLSATTEVLLSSVQQTVTVSSATTSTASLASAAVVSAVISEVSLFATTASTTFTASSLPTTTQVFTSSAQETVIASTAMRSTTLMASTAPVSAVIAEVSLVTTTASTTLTTSLLSTTTQALMSSAQQNVTASTAMTSSASLTSATPSPGARGVDTRYKVVAENIPKFFLKNIAEKSFLASSVTTVPHAETVANQVSDLSKSPTAMKVCQPSAHSSMACLDTLTTTSSSAFTVPDSVSPCVVSSNSENEFSSVLSTPNKVIHSAVTTASNIGFGVASRNSPSLVMPSTQSLFSRDNVMLPASTTSCSNESKEEQKVQTSPVPLGLVQYPPVMGLPKGLSTFSTNPNSPTVSKFLHDGMTVATVANMATSPGQESPVTLLPSHASPTGHDQSAPSTSKTLSVVNTSTPMSSSPETGQTVRQISLKKSVASPVEDSLLFNVTSLEMETTKASITSVSPPASSTSFAKDEVSHKPVVSCVLGKLLTPSSIMPEPKDGQGSLNSCQPTSSSTGLGRPEHVTTFVSSSPQHTWPDKHLSSPKTRLYNKVTAEGSPTLSTSVKTSVAPSKVFEQPFDTHAIPVAIVSMAKNSEAVSLHAECTSGNQILTKPTSVLNVVRVSDGTSCTISHLFSSSAATVHSGDLAIFEKTVGKPESTQFSDLEQTQVMAKTINETPKSNVPDSKTSSIDMELSPINSPVPISQSDAANLDAVTLRGAPEEGRIEAFSESQPPDELYDEIFAPLSQTTQLSTSGESSDISISAAKSLPTSLATVESASLKTFPITALTVSKRLPSYKSYQVQQTTCDSAMLPPVGPGLAFTPQVQSHNTPMWSAFPANGSFVTSPMTCVPTAPIISTAVQWPLVSSPAVSPCLSPITPMPLPMSGYGSQFSYPALPSGSSDVASVFAQMGQHTPTCTSPYHLSSPINHSPLRSPTPIQSLPKPTITIDDPSKDSQGTKSNVSCGLDVTSNFGYTKRFTDVFRAAPVEKVGERKLASPDNKLTSSPPSKSVAPIDANRLDSKLDDSATKLPSKGHIDQDVLQDTHSKRMPNQTSDNVESSNNCLVLEGSSSKGMQYGYEKVIDETIADLPSPGAEHGDSGSNEGDSEEDSDRYVGWPYISGFSTSQTHEMSTPQHERSYSPISSTGFDEGGNTTDDVGLSGYSTRSEYLNSEDESNLDASSVSSMAERKSKVVDEKMASEWSREGYSSSERGSFRGKSKEKPGGHSRLPCCRSKVTSGGSECQGSILTKSHKECRSLRKEGSREHSKRKSSRESHERDHAARSGSNHRKHRRRSKSPSKSIGDCQRSGHATSKSPVSPRHRSRDRAQSGDHVSRDRSRNKGHKNLERRTRSSSSRRHSSRGIRNRTRSKSFSNDSDSSSPRRKRRRSSLKTISKRNVDLSDEAVLLEITKPEVTERLQKYLEEKLRRTLEEAKQDLIVEILIHNTEMHAVSMLRKFQSLHSYALKDKSPAASRPFFGGISELIYGPRIKPENIVVQDPACRSVMVKCARKRPTLEVDGEDVTWLSEYENISPNCGCDTENIVSCHKMDSMECNTMTAYFKNNSNELDYDDDFRDVSELTGSMSDGENAPSIVVDPKFDASDRLQSTGLFSVQYNVLFREKRRRRLVEQLRMMRFREKVRLNQVAIAKVKKIRLDAYELSTRTGNSNNAISCKKLISTKKDVSEMMLRSKRVKAAEEERMDKNVTESLTNLNVLSVECSDRASDVDVGVKRSFTKGEVENETREHEEPPSWGSFEEERPLWNQQTSTPVDKRIAVDVVKDTHVGFCELEKKCQGSQTYMNAHIHQNDQKCASRSVCRFSRRDEAKLRVKKSFVNEEIEDKPCRVSMSEIQEQQIMTHDRQGTLQQTMAQVKEQSRLIGILDTNGSCISPILPSRVAVHDHISEFDTIAAVQPKTELQKRENIVGNCDGVSLVPVRNNSMNISRANGKKNPKFVAENNSDAFGKNCCQVIPRNACEAGNQNLAKRNTANGFKRKKTNTWNNPNSNANSTDNSETMSKISLNKVNGLTTFQNNSIETNDSRSSFFAREFLCPSEFDGVVAESRNHFNLQINIMARRIWSSFFPNKSFKSPSGVESLTFQSGCANSTEANKCSKKNSEESEKDDLDDSDQDEQLNAKTEDENVSSDLTVNRSEVVGQENLSPDLILPQSKVTRQETVSCNFNKKQSEITSTEQLIDIIPTHSLGKEPAARSQPTNAPCEILLSNLPVLDRPVTALHKSDRKCDDQKLAAQLSMVLKNLTKSELDILCSGSPRLCQASRGVPPSS